MVKNCPRCCSTNLSFLEHGEDTGKYFCEDCGFTGDIILGHDEFQD